MNNLNILNRYENFNDLDDERRMTDEEVTLRLATDAMKVRLNGVQIRVMAKLINAASGRKIPIDSRTILKTRTEKIGAAEFVHMGLVKGMEIKVKRGMYEVPVNMNKAHTSLNF